MCVLRVKEYWNNYLCLTPVVGLRNLETTFTESRTRPQPAAFSDVGTVWQKSVTFSLRTAATNAAFSSWVNTGPLDLCRLLWWGCCMSESALSDVVGDTCLRFWPCFCSTPPPHSLPNHSKTTTKKNYLTLCSLLLPAPTPHHTNAQYPLSKWCTGAEAN